MITRSSLLTRVLGALARASCWSGGPSCSSAAIPRSSCPRPKPSSAGSSGPRRRHDLAPPCHDPPGGRARLHARCRDRRRHRLRPGPQRARRAAAVAVPGGRPGRPILALAPLLALWFGPGLLSKVVICSLIVLLPGRDLDDGRHPLRRPAAAGAGAQPARHPPPAPDDPRDPRRAAGDPGRHARRRDAGGRGRGRRRMGRAPSEASVSSSTSPAGRSSISRSCSPPWSRSPCSASSCTSLVVVVERRLVGVR